jgi:hypothetical protein
MPLPKHPILLAVHSPFDHHALLCDYTTQYHESTVSHQFLQDIQYLFYAYTCFYPLTSIAAESDDNTKQTKA